MKRLTILGASFLLVFTFASELRAEGFVGTIGFSESKLKFKKNNDSLANTLLTEADSEKRMRKYKGKETKFKEFKAKKYGYSSNTGTNVSGTKIDKPSRAQIFTKDNSQDSVRSKVARLSVPVKRNSIDFYSNANIGMDKKFTKSNNGMGKINLNGVTTGRRNTTGRSNLFSSF